MTNPSDRVRMALEQVEEDLANRFRVELDDDSRRVIAKRLADGWDRLESTGRTEAFSKVASSIAPRLARAVAASVAVAGDEAEDRDQDDVDDEDVQRRIAGLVLPGDVVEGAFAGLCPGFWPFC